jgi:hypothetical protein
VHPFLQRVFTGVLSAVYVRGDRFGTVVLIVDADLLC